MIAHHPLANVGSESPGVLQKTATQTVAYTHLFAFESLSKELVCPLRWQPVLQR